MHVFQRTAPWIVPRTDRPITRAERFLFRHVPGAQRAMRTAVYWARESFAIPMLRSRLSQDHAPPGDEAHRTAGQATPSCAAR